MEDLLSANARAVLEVLRASKSHPTAQEVYDEVRHVRRGIGIATVYRILRQLAEQDMIKVWGSGSGSARYDACTHQHDHAFCTECGTLLDVPVAIELSLEALAEAARATSIEMSSYEVRIYGCCNSCQERRKV
jgi:Fur family transcriptional regulator, peroxide stress response regulator